MKLAIFAVVLALCAIAPAQAYWGWGGYGGLYGGYGGYGGWGYSGYNFWRRSLSEGEIEKRTQCQYLTDKGVLSCKGPSNLVECPATAKFTEDMKFDLYGLARTETVGDVGIIDSCFSLIPRSMDNVVWMNSSTIVDDVEQKLIISFLEKENTMGFTVTDETCWTNMVTYFKSCEATETITLVDGTDVSLFGEINVVSPLEEVTEEIAAEDDTEILEEPITENAKRHYRYRNRGYGRNRGYNRHRSYGYGRSYGRHGHHGHHGHRSGWY